MTSRSTIPTQMRALLQPDFDGPKSMHLISDAPVPIPGPGEVLLRVTSAGLNFADVMRARGLYQGGPKPPFIAGFEATGEIVALGDGVGRLEVGQHVIGIGDGAFAEYMLMPAAGVGPIPAGWRDEQALGLVLNWATALAALKLGRVAAGETVLVHAAAGGVGQAAVKMAKHYGATVIATASSSKHAVVRALGADHVIDYHAGSLVDQVRAITGKGGVDLVLESIGGDTFTASLTVARPITGRVVVFGAANGVASVSNAELIFRYLVHVIGLHIGAMSQKDPTLFGELMMELHRLQKAGVYLPGEPALYSLEKGVRALLDLESGTTVGKLALQP